MAQHFVGIGFPYYTAQVSDGVGAETGFRVTFQVETEAAGPLGGVTEDDVAVAIRDYLAGLSGVGSSSLTRREITGATL